METGDAIEAGTKPDATPALPPGTLAALRAVGKIFPNGVAAVRALDLDIKAGEFLAVLGPSGCGKSTALRMLAGLIPPSQGSIAWREERAAGDLSFVFQEPTLMPWATVFQNVWLPLKLAGTPARDASPRVMDTLAQVGLSDFADAYPRQLSGGMRMRVSIARALVTAPRVLLMDEPFAALDEITRFRLNDDLIALWRELKMTVVFVTHSVFESVYLSQRVVVMSARPGRIVSELAIDAAQRDAAFRTSAEYAAHCRVASEALARAMETPEQAA